MKSKLIGFVSLVETVLVTFWLVLLILGMKNEGTISTFEQRLAQVAKMDRIFFMSYLNAALLTIGATMLFSGLYILCKSASPEWSAMAVIFVPVYCALNLFVYLSQITIVPQLLLLQNQAEYQTLSAFLLRQMLQQWPSSVIQIVNLLAYAILGIPSIIFGLLLIRFGSTIRAGGILLALSGIVSIFGFTGALAQVSTLAFIGAAGSGALFWIALYPLTWGLLSGSFQRQRYLALT
jgi:hypothetical protein